MLLVVFTSIRHCLPEGANHINISLLALFVSFTYGNIFHSHSSHALAQKVQNFHHRSHKSISKPVHAGFVMHKLAMGQAFLRVLWSVHLYHAASVPCSLTHPSLVPHNFSKQHHHTSLISIIIIIIFIYCLYLSYAAIIPHLQKFNLLTS
jgi:hypothetical protein